MVEFELDLAQARRSRIFIRLESFSEECCGNGWTNNKYSYMLSNTVDKRNICMLKQLL
jgi:hypothetical protein